ncbi:MAG: trigger factor [Candidatus Gastranaerophilales bacterium]|nr:trigger factor [Candidatus Gastranaerophilales bacterium]
MAVKIENLENNAIKFDITIDAQDAEKAYKSAVSKFGKNASIPGFRKGKAPSNVVEKYVGKERIKVQVVEDLFPPEIRKAISENKLELAIQPAIESFSFEVGKDLTIVARAELKPPVELGQYKNLDIEYQEYKAPDNALDLEIEAVRTRFSTLETIKEDREATDKDIAVIDFEGFVNNEPIERGQGKAYALDLGHSNFIPGFAEGILGHKKGEEFTIDVTFPEDYGEEKLKGAKAQFKINLIKIRQRILPELNDEFAKKVGNFESVDALKKDIAVYIENSTKNENEKRKMETIFNKVIGEAKVNIQETMIAREIEAVFAETKQAAEQQGQDWDKIVAAQGMPVIQQQARDEAVRRIKNSLIIEKIAKSEGIKIEQADIVEQVSAIANAYKTSPQEILKEVARNNHFFTAITQQAAIKKVNDILLQNNKFIAK